MKERFIWFLSITRKFGFLMAFAMIFPYLAHVPALKASDGVDELLPHEVSMSELEEEYLLIETESIKEIERIQNFFSQVEAELAQYLVEVEPNIYELQIPQNASIGLTEEELNEFEKQLQITNQLMIEAMIIIDEDGTYYTVGEDDVFHIQSLTMTSYTRSYYHSVTIPFVTTIHVWYGIDLGLTRAGSIIIGGLLFGGGAAASWISTATVRTKINQFLGGSQDFFVGTLLDTVFTYLSRVGIANSLLNNLVGDSYVNVGVVLDILLMFATVFLTLRAVLLAAGGPLALFLSAVFAIAGGQMIDTGIGTVANGIRRGSSVVRFRLPLTLSTA